MLTIKERKNMTKKFINDVEKHEILKQAAIYSYNVNKKQIPKGYKLVKESKPSNTGFTHVL